MSFQIKAFNDIVLSQINHGRAVTGKITDWAPGSVARTLVEAPAVEIEELYLQMFLGLRDAIPVATFLSFGFDLLPAAHAHGFVSVSKSPAPTAPMTIPVGTVFTSVDGRQYASTAAVTWATGVQMIRVPVACTVAGIVGNVAAGVITSSALFPASSGYTVSNSLIENGRDAETDFEREARFSEFIASLSRGTVAACLYAAKQSRVLDVDGNIDEYVVRAGLAEVPGRVSIYVYSNRGIPSDALIADGQLRLDGTRGDIAGTITPGFRPAGVRVDVLPMDEREISMAVGVGMVSGQSLTVAVQQAITDAYGTAIMAAMPGETLHIGTIMEALLSVDGVASVVPGTTSNVICGVNEALVPGTLTITAL